MTITTVTQQPTAVERPSRGRPPGVFSPGGFWVLLYLGSMIGLSIDAILAAPVVDSAFNLPSILTYVIVGAIGVMVAFGATKAASWYNAGYRGRTVVPLLFVVVVGLMLGWLRLSVGVAGTAEVDTSAFGAAAVEAPNHELPATALMLGLYGLSAVSVYLTALKLFVPGRHELGRYEENRLVATERLGQLEGEFVAIQERLAYRANMLSLLEQQREHALANVVAREAQLKAYARDAIARAVGRPDATPLVRAPHEPSPEQADDADPHWDTSLL